MIPIFDKSQKTEHSSNSSKNNSLIIIPKKNLQTKSDLVQLEKIGMVKVISGGGFSFYKYETIVFGFISAFIRENHS